MTAPDVARLVAWIEAGEKTALAVGEPTGWKVAPGPGVKDDAGDRVVFVALETRPRFRNPIAAHIAAHDPAHELAIYAALRTVVDLHREPEGNPGYCVTCVEHDYTDTPWPCPTLRALVALAGDGNTPS